MPGDLKARNFPLLYTHSLSIRDQLGPVRLDEVGKKESKTLHYIRLCSTQHLFFPAQPATVCPAQTVADS